MTNSSSWSSKKTDINKIVKETSFINRLNSWYTTEEAAKWLVTNSKNKYVITNMVNKFIANMDVDVRAQLSALAAPATNRIAELMYSKKQVLNKDWKIVELEDNELNLKAAIHMTKLAGLEIPTDIWHKENKPEWLMSAIVADVDSTTVDV